MIPRADFMSGSQDLTPGVNFSFVKNGRLARVAASAGSLKGNLPDATRFKPGHPHFYILNGGSNAFDIADFGGNVIQNLTTGKAAIVSLLTNTTQNGVWVVAVRNQAALTAITPSTAAAQTDAPDPDVLITVKPAAAAATASSTNPTTTP